MIRRLIRRLLGPHTGDIYIVRDGTLIVGASTRLQGAERIKAEHVEAVLRSASDVIERREQLRRMAEIGTKIENHELQDGDA